MAQFSDLLVSQLVNYLDLKLASEYDARGWAPYAVVKDGRLQSDPERPREHVMVHIQHPQDTSWYDCPVGDRYIRYLNAVYGWERGFMSPLGEVGGRRRWYRRFAVEVINYYTRDRQDQASSREMANTLRALVEKLVLSFPVTAVKDEFGEQGVRIWVDRSRTEERGGPPNNYIWKSWVYVTAETDRPGC